MRAGLFEGLAAILAPLSLAALGLAAAPVQAAAQAAADAPRQAAPDGRRLALAFAEQNTLWSVEEPGVLRQWNTATREQVAFHALDELATLKHRRADD